VLGSSGRGQLPARALRAIRTDLEILSQACPLFVPLVEEGWHDDPVTEEVARRYLRPLLEAGVDTLVLGCTHYPLLKPVLQRVAGPDVALIDSAEQVAEMVASGLAEQGLQATHEAIHHFCVTDAGQTFQRLARTILRRTERPLGDALAPDELLVSGDLVVDAGRHEARIGGKAVELSALELRLLATLLDADGRALTRDQLLDGIHGTGEGDVLDRAIDVYVKRLREKLGDDANDPRYVATVRGVGYRAAGRVERRKVAPVQ